ncbi:single-stranded DNA-binding protein [Nonomuraea dietziae]|uniref:single-stranded DNA-binding protein n=1 Tax=Nonomuraea dietziae TaxID=65515 RepID=UPI0033DF6ECC
MDRNDVTLVGRLSASPDERAMPSGDTLTKWRIIVRRHPLVRRGGFVDTIQCVTFDAEVAAMVKAMRPRAPMEIRGALRCRIYGPPSAKSWRYEVEVHSVALVATEPSADPPATAEELPAEADLPAAPVLLTAASTPKPRAAAEIRPEPLLGADVRPELRSAADVASERHPVAEGGLCNDAVLAVPPTGAPEPHPAASAAHPTADLAAKAHLAGPRLSVPYPPQARGAGTKPGADHTLPTSAAASALNPRVPTIGPTTEADSAQSAATTDHQVSTDGASPVTLQPVATAEAAGSEARRATPTAEASPRTHSQDTVTAENSAKAPSDLAGSPPRPVAYLASTG